MQGMDSKSIRLTETVQKGGCAAKLPAGQLRTILANLKIKKPSNLKVGTEHMDDACLWDLGNGQGLVETLDFFTPIVDDAYDFGAIAAVNALSDVYAMGGIPKIALSILAFPSQTLPIELIEPLLRGALDKIEEAGACLAGGHTIDDETLKFGLSVTGFVDLKGAWTNSGARAGDLLLLTKALGTGTLTSALKRNEISEKALASVIESMKQLNRVPELISTAHVRAATDITGFGLAGHALQLARASDVSLRIEVGSLPILEGAMEALEKNILNRAHKTNLDYVGSETRYSEGMSDALRYLTVDPQTSGGLLLAVPPEFLEGVVSKCMVTFPFARVIGKVEAWNGENRLNFVS